MQKEEFQEKLNDALANENEIEKIIVFYKNGDKLLIGSEGTENEINEDNEVELAVEATSDDEDTNTSNAFEWKYNKIESVDKAMVGDTNAQMIYLPTGRKIIVIN